MTGRTCRGLRWRCRRALPALLALAGCVDDGAQSSAQQAAAEQNLRAPLPVPRPSFFHAALLVPPLQAAAVLPEQTAVLSLSSNHAQAKSFDTENGIRSWFSGAFHEWLAVDARGGVMPGLELSARSAVSGWDEAQDHFSLFDAGGNYIVRDEALLARGMATQRHENVARLDLGAKVALLDGDAAQTAASVMLKLPVARPGDLTNAGTFDFAATLLQSFEFGDFTVHGNGGAVWPTGPQNLFEPAQQVKLNPFVQGGLALDWRVGPAWTLDLQVQANRSAFHDVSFLRRAPITFVGGVRHGFGSSFVELSAGCGVDRASSDWWELFVGYGWVL